MKIVSAANLSSRKTMYEICHLLREGGVIAYPTETTYGFGCDPRRVDAVERIFRLKGREKNKSMLLVAASIAQVRKVAVLKGDAMKLAKVYWPGALTLVLPVGAHGMRPALYSSTNQDSDQDLVQGASLAPLPEGIIQMGDIAIRVSSSSIVQAVTRAYGFPLISTSANRSGDQPCRSAAAIIQKFSDTIDLMIDAGTLPPSKPSTIVRVGKDGAVDILREGAIDFQKPPLKSKRRLEEL